MYSVLKSTHSKSIARPGTSHSVNMGRRLGVGLRGLLLLLACPSAQAYSSYMVASYRCKRENNYFPLRTGFRYMNGDEAIAPPAATFALSVSNAATGEAVPDGSTPVAGTELKLSVTGRWVLVSSFRTNPRPTGSLPHRPTADPLPP